jgi:hypothetical protein
VLLRRSGFGCEHVVRFAVPPEPQEVVAPFELDRRARAPSFRERERVRKDLVRVLEAAGEPPGASRREEARRAPIAVRAQPRGAFECLRLRRGATGNSCLCSGGLERLRHGLIGTIGRLGEVPRSTSAAEYVGDPPVRVASRGRCRGAVHRGAHQRMPEVDSRTARDEARSLCLVQPSADRVGHRRQSQLGLSGGRK